MSGPEPGIRIGAPCGGAQTDHSQEHQASLAALSLGALGVVFGDISTSPLYALKECMMAAGGAKASVDDPFGTLSLMFWSLIMVVTVKYLTFVMRADHHGEAGIFALLAADAPEPGSSAVRWRERIRHGRVRQHGAVRGLHKPVGIRAAGARAIRQYGKANLRFPGQASWDMGLSKDIPLRERLKLQFRAEFFNVFNRVNFQQPNQSNQVDTVSSGGFGSIRAANDPRIGQLALKVIF